MTEQAAQIETREEHQFGWEYPDGSTGQSATYGDDYQERRWFYENRAELFRNLRTKRRTVVTAVTTTPWEEIHE